MPLTREEIEEIQARCHTAPHFFCAPAHIFFFVVSETMTMPWPQADAMADDLEIDMEKMSLWTKGSLAMSCEASPERAQ